MPDSSDVGAERTARKPIVEEGRDIEARVAVQPIRRQRRGGVALLLGALATLFVLPFVAGSLAWVPILLGVVGTIISISYLAGLQRGPGERSFVPGHYRLTQDGLWAWENFKAEQVITPDNVETGWCEAVDQGTAVVLRMKNGSLVAVQPPDEASLQLLLERAGLPPAARAERMRLGRDDVAGRRIAAVLLAPFVLVGVPMILGALGVLIVGVVGASTSLMASGLAACLSASLFGAVLWWLGSKLLPSWVSIGTDGVLVQKPFKTFIPFPQLSGARVDGGPAYFKVVLERTTGKPLRIPAATRDQADAIVRQVDAALDAFASRRKAALIEGLEPGEQVPEAWRRSLQNLMAKGGYRTQSVDREQLLRVVEDPGQPEKIRVAAVVALEPDARPEDKKRVRVAAEASASPKVRVALEQAVEGTIEDEVLAAMR